MSEIIDFFTERSYSDIIGNDTHLHCGICNQTKIYCNIKMTFNNSNVLVCGVGCSLTYHNITQIYNCKDNHSKIEKIDKKILFDYKCPTCKQFFTETEYHEIKDNKYDVLAKYYRTKRVKEDKIHPL
jgi:hypothetical protein